MLLFLCILVIFALLTVIFAYDERNLKTPPKNSTDIFGQKYCQMCGNLTFKINNSCSICGGINKE